MNSLGFKMTVRHAEPRNPHILKENEKQLAQNVWWTVDPLLYSSAHNMWMELKEAQIITYLLFLC